MKYEPDVMKFYTKHVLSIFDMPKSCQKILGYVLKNMNDDNLITIALGTKADLLEKTGLKNQTLRNNLAKLAKSGILANPRSGVYIVNPEIFSVKKKWGDVLNQQRQFRATIDYEGESFNIRGAFLNEKH